MARKPRLEFPGALYHVISRGNQRQAIFRDTADHEAYLSRLEQYRKRYRVKLFAFVLMSNHIHLLVEVGTTPLSKFMQGLQFTQTQYFNRKYGKVGHLFQGRYKAILCEKEAYLLELVRYIHLNPARLRKPRNPWTYPWSSHRAYLGQGGPVHVETDAILGLLGRSRGAALKGYLQFMKEGLPFGHQERYYAVVDGRLLGDERFVEEVKRQVPKDRRVEGLQVRVGLPRLLEVVAEVHGVGKRDMRDRTFDRRVCAARRQFVYVARQFGRVPAKKVAEFLGRDPTQISHLFRLYEESPDSSKEILILETINSHA